MQYRLYEGHHFCIPSKKKTLFYIFGKTNNHLQNGQIGQPVPRFKQMATNFETNKCQPLLIFTSKVASKE